MIGRRKSPDGLPFRLYVTKGRYITSFRYKLPDNTIAFRLSAATSDKQAVENIRREAINRALELNGELTKLEGVDKLIREYFAWQYGLPENSEMRKANNTLKTNEQEAKRLAAVFGKMEPSLIKPAHIYKYLDIRAQNGAPAKANKEIALLSAILEYGRRRGVLESNPCRGIKYNKTRPRTKYVPLESILFVLDTAREMGGAFLRVALCIYVAYLTVSRPEEMRQLTRHSITDEGVLIAIGKRKKGQAQKSKLIAWSPELRQAINDVLPLQKTMSMYVFGNDKGKPYTPAGFATIQRRLMDACEKKAKDNGVTFERFALVDMRPSAVTDRMKEGDENIINATGHADGRMVQKVYDRRTVKKANATR